MIARIVHFVIKPNAAGNLATCIEHTVLPILENAAGFHDLSVLQIEGEPRLAMVVTSWREDLSVYAWESHPDVAKALKPLIDQQHARTYRVTSKFTLHATEDGKRFAHILVDGLSVSSHASGTAQHITKSIVAGAA